MHDSLHRAISASQRTLTDQIAASTTAVHDHDAPRQVIQTTDAFLIQACRHIGAVCDVILPAAASHLPDGDKRVQAYVQQAKRLERSVAQTKRRLYGESHAIHLSWSSVWSGLGEEFDKLMDLERTIVDDLHGELDPRTSSALADRMAESEINGPTRPHPHSPHTGRFAHVTRSMWTRADRFWNAAEGRTVSGVVKAFKAPSKLAS